MDCFTRFWWFFLFLFFTGKGFLYAGSCLIEVPTSLPGKTVLEIDDCKFGGTLKKAGPHYSGKFVIDLHALGSSNDEVNFRLKSYFKSRYATAYIIPFDSSDKQFKALLKLNGTSKIIKVDIINLKKESMVGRFKIDLRDFNFKEGYGWDLIQKIITINFKAG